MKTSVFGFSAGIELSILEDYRQSMESLLTNQKQKFEKWAEAEAEKLDDEQKEEFYDFYSDEFSELEHVFPNIMRSSLFVATYSILEKQLVGHCRQLWRKNKYPKEPIFTKGIVFKARDYLCQNAGIFLPDNSLNWIYIVACNKIRNAIAHNGGKLDSKKLAELTPFLALNQSITLDQFNRVLLGEDACKNFIQVVRSFFVDEIFTATKK